ncbi:MAG TPA: hypothetical protein VFY23_01275 [Candidatus Limnocylindrales bacterium]|nr:hypothetical protein [Candidatus Limnocylindrales bacterium]
MLKRVVAGSLFAATSWIAYYRVTRWRATWGVDPAEALRRLPGDELVPDASAVDTRGITIAAPPEAVWPWLVQMGYGRGGWYSYDVMDMRGRSADTIVPELQSLAVGDLVPTDPDGGFVVRSIDPGRSLVLGVDAEVLAARREKALEKVPVGLAASGKLLETSVPPQFAASWAFVLEPDGAGGSRLIERFRAWFGAATPGSRAAGPFMGFGVFVMMRRQMLGIRARAERLAGAPDAVTGAAVDAEPVATSMA